MPKSKLNLVEKFWSLVVKQDGCWIWLGSKDKNGYGVFGFNKRVLKAHRVSYELHFAHPNSLFVCHTCDNPQCVNPSHLFLGSAKDNAKDMSEKGRTFNQKKTHCIKGHPFDAENTYIKPDGKRQCRTCRKEDSTFTRLKDVEKHRAAVRKSKAKQKFA